MLCFDLSLGSFDYQHFFSLGLFSRSQSFPTLCLDIVHCPHDVGVGNEVCHESVDDAVAVLLHLMTESVLHSMCDGLFAFVRLIQLALWNLRAHNILDVRRQLPTDVCELVKCTIHTVSFAECSA